MQKQLGAAAKIESVSIGWGGTTTVSGVTITLPMARQPIVQIKQLTVRHDALPLMLVDLPGTNAQVLPGLASVAQRKSLTPALWLDLAADWLEC